MPSAKSSRISPQNKSAFHGKGHIRSVRESENKPIVLVQTGSRNCFLVITIWGPRAYEII